MDDQTDKQRDLRSDELHSCRGDEIAQMCDARSDRQHLSKFSQIPQKTWSNFAYSMKTRSNPNNHCRESSVDSEQSDDGYDKYNKVQIFFPLSDTKNLRHQSSASMGVIMLEREDALTRGLQQTEEPPSQPQSQ